MIDVASNSVTIVFGRAGPISAPRPRFRQPGACTSRRRCAWVPPNLFGRGRILPIFDSDQVKIDKQSVVRPREIHVAGVARAYYRTSCNHGVAILRPKPSERCSETYNHRRHATAPSQAWRKPYRYAIFCHLFRRRREYALPLPESFQRNETSRSVAARFRRSQKLR